VAAHHREVSPVALQQVVDEVKPGALAQLPWRRIPQHPQAAAGLQYARNLVEGAWAVEPVESLRYEDRVGAGTGERHVLGGARHRLGDWYLPSEQVSHLAQRLDRNDPVESRGQVARQLARTGAQIDDY
jgi:hypothetical protein